MILKFGLTMIMAGVMLLMFACDRFVGPATSVGDDPCKGHCTCAAGCCNLAQIDCSGVLCHNAGDPVICEATTDMVEPPDIMSARKRDAGR